MKSKYFTKILVGGGVISKDMALDNSGDILSIMLLALFVLLIKGILVMFSYNWIAPKLIFNFRNQYKLEDFRPLTIWEAIIVVILFNNLFSRY